MSKTNDFKKVICKTCADYKAYMEGEHDDDASIKNNPAPEDGMKKGELLKLSDIEILNIINSMATTDNKSDIRNMYAHGYAFSWSDLKNVADVKGFTKKDPSARHSTYYMTDTDNEETVIYNKVNHSTGFNSPTTIEYKNTDDPTKRFSDSVSITVYKRWKKFTDPYKYKHILVDAALTYFMDEYEAGHIKFEIKN